MRTKPNKKPTERPTYTISFDPAKPHPDAISNADVGWPTIRAMARGRWRAREAARFKVVAADRLSPRQNMAFAWFDLVAVRRAVATCTGTVGPIATMRHE